MRNILGLDPGTNSFGTYLRNPNIEGSVIKQTEYFSVDIFKSGVNSDECSYAADRSRSRRSRVLYERRRYRNWATLKLLIENNLCPLTSDNLNKWRTYDKKKGFSRQYPIDDVQFERWIRLDFDNDGKPDYSSPYQLRRELMSRQFDFTQEIDRFKLGRALYHFSQRRGFKSSKGETLKEMEYESINGTAQEMEEYTLKKSEEKKSGPLVEYMNNNGLKTVGCAFAQLEDEGVRIRNSIYQAVRSQYKEEIEKIFEYQDGLDLGSDLFRRLVSSKKGEGTIFYKCPLKSQKQNVGHCKLETKKTRCPISHPLYEEFRAWTFINNIKFRTDSNAEWQELPMDVKKAMYLEKFCARVKSDFRFEELRLFIEKRLNVFLYNKPDNKTINYKDNQIVAGCPVIVRLKNILGEDWETATIPGTKIRQKRGIEYKATYNAYDLWNICYNTEDVESLEVFAERTLGWVGSQVKELVKLWDTIQEGYAMLSIKAMRNINYFLHRGLVYSDAVALAKVPECLGESLYNEHEDEIIRYFIDIIKPKRKYEKLIKGIANNLISRYKCLSVDEGERFAFKDTTYKIDNYDKKQCEHIAKITVGSKSWEHKSEEDRRQILKDVEGLYQKFFSSSNRDYYKLDKVSEMLKDYLKTEISGGDMEVISKLDSLYHHSDITLNASSICDDEGTPQLPPPNILPIKNPAVMRVLNIMRNKINNMLSAKLISAEETRVVVENTRVMNDANMRKAIELYQKSREDEYKEINKILNDVLGTQGHEYSKEDKNKVRLFLEQPIDTTSKKRFDGISDEKIFSDNAKKCIAKYKLWKEQGCMCLYTGNIINLSTLFSERVDFEHTIPRSLSFDDSFANLTVCDSHFNRSIKKSRIPSELENYLEILPRLENWKKRVERLKDNVRFWIEQARKARTKERKDYCIVQKHLWNMELEYWENKIQRFTCKEVTQGFRNRQLVDTGIVTKYAAIYLKTVFKNVDVQKGEVTAVFRKIFGIQRTEQKDRSMHSHHAVDAAVLTMIPIASMREHILELYYKREESFGSERQYYSNELEKAVRELGLSQNCDEIRHHIEKELIVAHHKKDRALLPTSKKRRNNGRLIYNDVGEERKVLYSRGSCIRGNLNDSTYYGAICIEGDIKYVVRRELKFKTGNKAKGFYNWEDLDSQIVDKNLLKMMKEQFPEGTTFKDACEKGIYTIRKNDNKKLSKIRHVRCYAIVKNPVKLKKHIYLSEKEYKQHIYAQSGDLYTMVRYSNKHKTIFIPYSLWDISENRKKKLEDIPSVVCKNDMQFVKEHSLVVNDILLLYGKDETPLTLSNENIFNRIYVVKGFEKDGNRIILVKNICAKSETELGKGECVKDWVNLPEKIRCCITTLNYLILNKEFVIDAKNNKVRFVDCK